MNCLVYILFSYITDSPRTLILTFAILFVFIFCVDYQSKKKILNSIFYSLSRSFIITFMIFTSLFLVKIMLFNTEIINRKGFDELLSIQKDIKSNKYTESQKEILKKIISKSLEDATIRDYELVYLKMKANEFTKENNQYLEK